MSDGSRNGTNCFTVDRSPCFISKRPEDTSTVWSQRCIVATVAHQLMPCPRGGFCQGEKLVSCEFDVVGDPSVPSLDGSFCSLAPDAKVTFDTLIENLKDLFRRSMRFEPLSMPVRSHGQPMTALTDMPPRPMFPYNNLVRELEFALNEGDEMDLSENLIWLEPALRNRIVNHINIEWNDQGV
jgi:hypothetical protein